MAKRAVQIGRVQPGHHFQADRYSFSERRRRREKSLFAGIPGWWAEASPLARFIRVWWWGICALVGTVFGYVVVVLFAGIALGLR
jgi:hypothetical protein